MTMRMSVAEFKQLQGKRDVLTRMRALGRLPAGQMNKTEARYAAHLDVLKNLGLVLWWAFEAVTFRLAPRTSYTPDFLVLTRDGVLEVHECKGHWTDDARVKIKVAAAMFPLVFKAVTAARGGTWHVEEFAA